MCRARRLVAFLRWLVSFTGLVGATSTLSKLRLQDRCEICSGVRVRPVLSDDWPEKQLMELPELCESLGGVFVGLWAMGFTESTLKLCT